MNITTFKKVLLPILKEGITPWVWGYHAKGKSETIETFYKDRGWLCFNFRLNTQADVGDFLGLQDFISDENGNKTATKFCMPEWLKTCIDFCKKNPNKRAAIFIDEINRAARFDLLGPVFQMALDKRLHTYEFPENLDVICAANPNTKNYKVLTVSDEALLSRFWHVYFEPTVQEWYSYTNEKNYADDIVDFIKENPKFLESSDSLESFSVSDYTKPDRRKWHMVNKLYKNSKLTKEECTEVFAGLVGIEAALAFEGFLKKQDKGVTLEEILNSYDQVRDVIIKASNTEKARTDIIGKAVNELITHFSDNPDIKEHEGENVIKFIKDLPNDQMFNTLHSIYCKRKFHDFCETNYEKLGMNEIENILSVIRQTVSPETLLQNKEENTSKVEA